MTADALSRDLVIIQHWAFQWKMGFNPDATKQAKEVIRQSQQHPPLFFNDQQIAADTITNILV